MPIKRIESLCYATATTAAGDCAMVWTDTVKYPQRLFRLYPACPDNRLLLRQIHEYYPSAIQSDGVLPVWLKPVQRFLIAYYSGDRKSTVRARLDWRWMKKHLHWAGQTDFGRKVLAATFKIKPGTTFSYGELARHIARPRAARAVGGALARNPWPVVIPCHRVIGSDGSLTGFSGYGAVATKKWMLAMERENFSTP